MIQEIRKRVAGREGASVSRFIQKVIQKSLENEIAFQTIIDEALAATGGPLTAKERAWAKRMLSPRKRIGAGKPEIRRR